MRIVASLATGLALACGLAAADCARADHAPVLVIPGRPGVPVVINGYDASYTVVEGDWGLSRPGHMPPAIVSGPLILPAPYDSGAYFPSQGRRPGYGRREIEPPPDRRLPPSAPSYYREWGAQSQQLPATIPNDPPPVIPAAPYDDVPEQQHRRDRRHHNHHQHHNRRHRHSHRN